MKSPLDDPTFQRFVITRIKQSGPAAQAPLLEELLGQDNTGAALVRRLVERGTVRPNLEMASARDGYRSKLIHSAAVHNRVGVLHALLAKGANPNALDENGATPPHLAIDCKSEAAALHLVNNVPACDLNIQSSGGVAPRMVTKVTPLMMAAGRGLVPMIKALLANGAEVELKDREGNTALKWAVSCRKEDAALCLLLEGGAEWRTPYSPVS